MRQFAKGLAIFLFLTGCATNSQIDNKSYDATLLDYGLCSINLKGTVSAGARATAAYTATEGVHFYKKTLDIPAKLGVGFGIKYVINGHIEGKPIALKARIIHPAIRGETKSEAFVNARIGLWRSDFYTFDQGYELQPGNWVFQIYHNDKLLIEKSFNVKKS